MSKSTVKRWLKLTAYDKLYWALIKEKAKELLSDGCSGVPDWYVWTCWEHDIHYRTHRFLCGRSITFKTANYIMRRRIQQSSPFGFFSPVAWGRWLGLAVIFRYTSKKAWDTYGTGSYLQTSK